MANEEKDIERMLQDINKKIAMGGAEPPSLEIVNYLQNRATSGKSPELGANQLHDESLHARNKSPYFGLGPIDHASQQESIGESLNIHLGQFVNSPDKPKRKPKGDNNFSFAPENYLNENQRQRLISESESEL